MCGNEPRQHRMTSASSALDQLGQYEPAGHVGILTDTIHARPVVTRTAQSAAGLHKHKHGILTNVYEQKHLSEMQAAHAFQNAAAARPYQQFMQHAPPPLGKCSGNTVKHSCSKQQAQPIPAKLAAVPVQPRKYVFNPHAPEFVVGQPIKKAANTHNIKTQPKATTTVSSGATSAPVPTLQPTYDCMSGTVSSSKNNIMVRQTQQAPSRATTQHKPSLTRSDVPAIDTKLTQDLPADLRPAMTHTFTSPADMQLRSAAAPGTTWLTSDSVKEAEKIPCTRQEAALDDQKWLGKSDFKISTRVQEVFSNMLQQTTELTHLIRSDKQPVTEDQDQLNQMYIDVAAVARRVREAKDSRDLYLHEQWLVKS